jgi:hypothetical protein
MTGDIRPSRTNEPTQQVRQVHAVIDRLARGTSRTVEVGLGYGISALF